VVVHPFRLGGGCLLFAPQRLLPVGHGTLAELGLFTTALSSFTRVRRFSLYFHFVGEEFFFGNCLSFLPAVRHPVDSPWCCFRCVFGFLGIGFFSASFF